MAKPKLTNHQQFYVDHYGKLIGKTVKSIGLDDSDGDSIFALKFTDGTLAFILCDEEGNGAGFLDIESGK